MLTVHQIEASDTYHLRHTILRPNQSFEDCKYNGDNASTSFHLGAFWEANLISIASFHQEAFPELGAGIHYRLRGMATDPNFRRQKAGSSLITFAENILRERQCVLLWCNARINVIDYYKKLGFIEHGEVFDLVPIGLHRVMFKEPGSTSIS